MNIKKGQTTIHDIAKHVGVSPATVSRVFSNTSYPIANKTKEKVLSAARQLGYPKTTSTLAAKCERVIVLIPDLMNPYYTSLIAGLECSLRMSGISMVLVNTGASIDLEKKMISEIDVKSIKGVIISPVSNQVEHIALLIKRGVQVIVLEQAVELECSKVFFNYKKGGELATQYLIDRGLRSIGFISSPLTRFSRREVYDGYLSALQKNGLAVDERLIRIAKNELRQTDDIYEIANGRMQIQQMIDLKNLPDGVFCANDITAIGVLGQLHKENICVPQDISVIGFDNVFYSGCASPPLTTIDQCVYEIGSMAAELLNRNIIDPNRKCVDVTLEPRLVIRDSVV